MHVWPCNMQHRKRIGPLQWDLSVAEHLQPGESYRGVRFESAVSPMQLHAAWAAVQERCPCQTGGGQGLEGGARD